MYCYTKTNFIISNFKIFEGRKYNF